jgi:hypothetical protein
VKPKTIWPEAPKPFVVGPVLTVEDYMTVLACVVLTLMVVASFFVILADFLVRLPHA